MIVTQNIDNKEGTERLVFKELKDKVAVESPFEEDLKSFFNKIVRDLESTNKNKSFKKKTVNIETNYLGSLNSILQKYYAQATKKAINNFLGDKELAKLLDKQTINELKNNSTIFVS